MTTTISSSMSVMPRTLCRGPYRACSYLPQLPPGLTPDVDAAALSDANELPGRAASDLVLVARIVREHGRRIHDADLGRHGRRRHLDRRAVRQGRP